ncbi:branched-chain amino acid aminotransferase [Salinispora arenicola]|uniref:branched-chain amino acid aminotransferase n=1 Tax=Salinispora arenicola TaxID=168697 RepID=UPI00037BE993|nr:branched-chain amino acid aminotransferase [Salinispora arenicola]
MSITTNRPEHTAEHGELLTEHLVGATWDERRGWSATTAEPYRDLSLDPATIGLHYGQVIFEGLKAHRRADDRLAIFRPGEHARRFQRSARRLCMPELPVGTFLSSLRDLVRLDGHLLSDDPGLSLYLRPLMFGTDRSLMLRPSRGYRYLLMAFIAGGFFGDAVAPVSVMVNRDYPRAFPGGTGDVKCAANYAPSFAAQRQAQQFGCDQVVWLDATSGQLVEELGGMNLFFVRRTGTDVELVTPQLTGTLLPGVTRDALLKLGRRLGYRTSEEPMPIDQWRAECRSGRITETFACGTAAVVTPVGRVRDRDGDWNIGDGGTGPVTTRMRETLVDLHHGRAADPDAWMEPVD